MTAPDGATPGGLGRRQLLQAGGLTIGLGALLAACGSDTVEGEPGRVGYAPVPTALRLRACSFACIRNAMYW